jgi:hypothetical protein
VNAIVGFTAILLMTGTFRIRAKAAADRAAAQEAQSGQSSDGRSAPEASGRRNR